MIRRSAALVAVLAAAQVSSCGGEPQTTSSRWADACTDVPPDHCFASNEANVIVEPGVAVHDKCIDRAIGRALEYWSASPNVLNGWLVVFSDHEIACNETPASGCCDWSRKVLEVQVLDPKCPETAQLVHELGHILHQDAGHEGPFWCWETEQQATRNIVRASDASPGCGDSPWYTWAADLARGCRPGGDAERSWSAELGLRPPAGVAR